MAKSKSKVSKSNDGFDKKVYWNMKRMKLNRGKKKKK